MVRIKVRLLYWLAGLSLVGAWWVPQLLDARPPLQLLRHLGWVVLTIAVALVWASFVSCEIKTKGQQEGDRPCASITIRRGIYAVVRHPRHLGWLLLYAAVMMVVQHWLAAGFALLGMVCVYLLARAEDLQRGQELGLAYEQYKRCVPALNLVAGVRRLLRRSKKDQTLGGPANVPCEIRTSSEVAGDLNDIVPQGYCFCLVCGHRQKQQEIGLCSDSWCPKCGARMMHS